MDQASGDQFTWLLARADISQAAFARQTGLSTRQVNNWCRGRAAVPRWAVLLALAFRELSVEALTILLDEFKTAETQSD